jgi:peptide alpha-N-acetyltransferase
LIQCTLYHVLIKLSETVFTYRYFLHRFPELCIFAIPENDTSPNPEPIGCIVCKIDPEDEDDDQYQDPTAQTYNDEYVEPKLCGYIGMLAVDTSYRRTGIGSALAKRAVRRMEVMGCSSVILETEVKNKSAMKLYEERLGFMREEFLVRYYLNNGDAYRLRLWLK